LSGAGERAGLLAPQNCELDTLMQRQIIQTSDAPRAIGTYSQAVKIGGTVYLSGQIPLDPVTGQLVSGDIDAEIRRAFDNLKAIAKAAGGSLDNAVKLTVFLTDLGHFNKVNEIMATYFREPYPARAAVGVAALPRGARFEVECILSLA
jgi:reactive intermediate/imine deaminase